MITTAAPKMIWHLFASEMPRAIGFENTLLTMHRTGTDPDNVRTEDILCDFCLQPWGDSRPMVEGHHGSCICGNCLRMAHGEVIAAGGGIDAPVRCSLCLEDRPECGYQSPLRPEAVACKRCVRMATTALARDVDSGWTV